MALEPRRRTARIFLRLPVVLSGTDANRETFNEQAETVDIGKYGAKVLTTRRLRVGAVISVRRINSDKAEAFRVVYVGEPEPESRKFPVGLELASIEDFWGQSFPPDNWQ